MAAVLTGMKGGLANKRDARSNMLDMKCQRAILSTFMRANTIAVLRTRTSMRFESATLTMTHAGARSDRTSTILKMEQVTIGCDQTRSGIVIENTTAAPALSQTRSMQAPHAIEE